MRRIPMLLAVISIAVSGCNNRPERLVNQHPPVPDLSIVPWSADVPPGVCTTEPPVPSEAVLDADPAAGLRWEAETLTRGRACRDAHVRACRWHQDRAAASSPPVVIAGLRCSV